MSQALQLSPEQSRAVIGSWHRFVEAVGKLLVHRRDIHARLWGTAHDGTCSHDFAEKYTQASVDSAAVGARVPGHSFLKRAHLVDCRPTS